MQVRYAVYYAPEPASALWRFGSAVLGFDAVTGEPCPQWRPGDMPEVDWLAATADPRLYGFHATLKAPFRLASDRSEVELVDFLQAFCRRTASVDLGASVIDVVSPEPDGGFVALIRAPDAVPNPPLAALEGAIVREFDAFRAPLSEAEIARRNPDRLSPRQRGNLDRFGYPFVLDDFMFHMSLTGRIAASDPVAKALRNQAQAVGADTPLAIDRLALFRQENGGRFRVLAAAPLSGPRP